MRAGRKPTSQTRDAQHGRTVYAARVVVGVCANNAAHVAAPGRVLCADCGARARAANASLVRVRRINGQCRECPALLAVGDLSRCAECRERRKNRPSRKHAYRLRNERGYANKERHGRGKRAA